MAILSHPNPLGRKVMSLRDSNLFLCSRKENTNQILEQKDCGRNRNRDTARNWYSVMPRRYSLGGCLQGGATRCKHVPYTFQVLYERHDSNGWRVARWALHPLRSLPAKGFNDHALEAIEPQCQGAPNTCLVWVMVLVMVTGVVRTKGKRI